MANAILCMWCVYVVCSVVPIDGLRDFGVRDGCGS